MGDSADTRNPVALLLGRSPAARVRPARPGTPSPRSIDVVESVFVSSVIRGMGDVRAAAREAIESLGLRPIMAETHGADPSSPQRAMLREVAEADCFLLLLGERYGEVGPTGTSPTEDEFSEAVRRNKPILVMRQDVEMEPSQAEFLERVGGAWKGGRAWGGFTDAGDVALKVVQAIRNAERSGEVGALAPRAQERAAELAHAVSERQTGYYSGSQARGRVVFVPLVDLPLLDVIVVQNGELDEPLAGFARTARIVPQAIGITTTTSAEGFTVTAGEARQGERPFAVIKIDMSGAVLLEHTVSVADERSFGQQRVDPERLGELVGRAAVYSLAVWDRIDAREEVQQVAVTLGLAGASQLRFGSGSASGSGSMFGTGARLPETLVVPEPPLIMRRSDLSGEQLKRRVLAEVRQRYADANALAE